MNQSRLQTALAVIPVASAGLYLLGFAYNQGYLDTFGIDDSLFPLSTDRSLLFGFYAAIGIGLVPMLYAFVAIAVLFVSVMVVAVISSAPRVKKLQGRLIEICSWRHRGEISPTMTALVDKSGTIYSYVGGTLLALFLFALVPFFAAKSGREQAQKEIDAFGEHKSNWVMLYSPLLPTPAKAKQISCSGNHCAFWLGTESLVLRHESIERLVTHNPVVEGRLHDKAKRHSLP